jgi:hypothetical protein
LQPNLGAWASRRGLTVGQVADADPQAALGKCGEGPATGDLDIVGMSPHSQHAKWFGKRFRHGETMRKAGCGPAGGLGDGRNSARERVIPVFVPEG